jgi:hypothetical protein
MPEAPPPARRRHAGLVIGVGAGCALILVAAGIARVGHASSTPSPAVATATDGTAPASEPLPADTAPSPATATPNGAPAPALPDASSSTGTVRLARGVSPNRVLFDGKKLSSSSAVVSCGTHQVKVGRGRAHSVDVPCGGAIDVTK